MAGHAQLKFVMTECSKTQIRLTGLIYGWVVLSWTYVDVNGLGELNSSDIDTKDICDASSEFVSSSIPSW